MTQSEKHIGEIKILHDEINWRVKVAYTSNVIFLGIVTISSNFLANPKFDNFDNSKISLAGLIIVILISMISAILNGNHLIEKRIEHYILQIQKKLFELDKFPHHFWLSYLYGYRFKNTKIMRFFSVTTSTAIGLFQYIYPIFSASFLLFYLIFNFDSFHHYPILFIFAAFTNIISFISLLYFLAFVSNLSKEHSDFFLEKVKPYIESSKDEVKIKVSKKTKKLTNHWINNQIIAHRGLHDCNNNIPENSLTAFQKAIDKGYAIEFDVQLSKDNKLIVFHDYDLIRTCNISNKLNNLTLSEIKTLNLFDTNEKIPTLKEVLELINNQVPILIEIKNENSVGLLEEKLNNILINYKGDFAIQSFNPKSLNWFYKNNSTILRGQLSSRFKDVEISIFMKFILSNFHLNFLSRPDFVVFNVDDLPKNKVNRLRKNIPVLGWTIDTTKKLKKSKKFCDNIIFECLKIE